MIRRTSQTITAWFVVWDLALTALAWLGSYWLRFDSGLIPFDPEIQPDFVLYLGTVPSLISLLALVSYRMAGMYEVHRLRRFREELLAVVKGIGLMALAVMATSFGAAFALRIPHRDGDVRIGALINIVAGRGGRRGRRCAFCAGREPEPRAHRRHRSPRAARCGRSTRSAGPASRRSALSRMKPTAFPTGTPRCRSSGPSGSCRSWSAAQHSPCLHCVAAQPLRPARARFAACRRRSWTCSSSPICRRWPG